MALDGGGELGRDADPAGEDAAHERVVDAELTALDTEPILGAQVRVVDELRVLAVEAAQDRTTEVVEERRGGEVVARGQVRDLGDPLGG
jgi:hypothetical protein